MLPNTPVPKIDAFDSGKKPIVFLKHLGKGDHAHVWKVSIRNKIYALKMIVKFLARDITFGNTEYDDDDWNMLNEQITPFNCEARAYGRLKETGKDHVSIKCHGYMLLDETRYGRALEKCGYGAAD